MKVLVVGGGIGGLALAGKLIEEGIETIVCEQSPRMAEVGAGIQLSPNAMRVLQAAGLGSEVLRYGFAPEAFTGWDWKSGKNLYRRPIKGLYEELYGAPYIHIHRADIQHILASKVPATNIVLGAKISALEERGNRVVARFEDGREVTADVVVGADGIHSVVRKHLHGDTSPQFTGNMCWRGMVPADELPKGLVPPTASNWHGPHGHVVTYYVRGGTAVNFVAVMETSAWLEESWTAPSDVSELLKTFAGWNPRLLTLLGKAGTVFRWGLFDRDPLTHWSRGRVTLLGDAAHPMLPFLAQGAAQALEDAHALASWLIAKPDDVESALKLYEQERIERTARVQLGARARGKTVHLASPWARFKRNLGFRLQEFRNPTTTAQQAEWIYSHDVTAVERASSRSHVVT